MCPLGSPSSGPLATAAFPIAHKVKSCMTTSSLSPSATNPGPSTSAEPMRPRDRWSWRRAIAAASPVRERCVSGSCGRWQVRDPGVLSPCCGDPPMSAKGRRSTRPSPRGDDGMPAHTGRQPHRGPRSTGSRGESVAEPLARLVPIKAEHRTIVQRSPSSRASALPDATAVIVNCPRCLANRSGHWAVGPRLMGTSNMGRSSHTSPRPARST